VSLEVALGTDLLELAFSVAPGEALALVGPSGAGKTSVLRAIAGLARPARGTVACGGVVWSDAGRRVHRPPEARRCGFLFQSHALFPHLSGWRNVAYGAPHGRDRAAAVHALEALDVGHLADRRPATYSGGEAQRVALARALAREPDALLLDEPLSALDARTRSRATRLLQGVLRDRAEPTVLVTHDWAEAAVLADRVAVMDAGRIVQTGTPAELAAAPATSFVADLTGAVVLLGAARRRDDGLTEVALDGGGSVLSTVPREGRVAAIVRPWEVALEPAGAVPAGSPQNRLDVAVTSVAELGSRVRVGLVAPQPLVAEVTPPAATALGLAPGVRVTAVWKAAATRLTED
jgi:molybdate transport system ATP-binding protein